MSVVVERRRYNTETATLLAGDDYWNGNNWERHGRQTYLYRTPRGRYFVQHLTCWQGERDSLTPVELDEAISLYEGPLSEHRVDYEEAFPDVEVEDA